VAGDIVEVICPLQIATTDTYTQSAVNNAFQANTNNFAAGKNHIINGDFFVNQRGFTSNTGNTNYNFDRWLQQNSGGTFTLTPQTFTPGAAPVAGYEGANFLRGIIASQSASTEYAVFTHRIEDVRTLAGTTATVSFWAKASTGTPKIAIELGQQFGSGGSPSARVNASGGAVTLSTGWVRYSANVTVPSLTGKTIGTTANTSYLELNLWVSAGSDFNTRASSIGIQSNTFDIWGVQVEAGSNATAFQTATGTIQGELAACQRYYWKAGGDNAYQYLGMGTAVSSTETRFLLPHPVQMRVKPTAIEFSTLAVYDVGGATFYAATTVTQSVASVYTSGVTLNVASGLTTQRPFIATTNNSLSGYIAFSAEL
jgi:hypothetical protein